MLLNTRHLGLPNVITKDNPPPHCFFPPIFLKGFKIHSKLFVQLLTKFCFFPLCETHSLPICKCHMSARTSKFRSLCVRDGAFITSLSFESPLETLAFQAPGWLCKLYLLKYWLLPHMEGGRYRNVSWPLSNNCHSDILIVLHGAHIIKTSHRWPAMPLFHLHRRHRDFDPPSLKAECRTALTPPSPSTALLIHAEMRGRPLFKGLWFKVLSP